jgi:hypothetical protein
MGSGPHRQLLALALPTFLRLADQFNYDVVIGTGSEADPRPASWSKIPLLLTALDRYDLVLWLDADTAVVSFDDDPALCLPIDSYQAFVAHQWDDETMPNAGVWLLRSGDRSKDFLRAVWSLEQYTDHHLWENAAILELLGFEPSPWRPGSPTRWSEGTTCLDPSWNVVRGFCRARRSHIHHYAGRSLTSRRWGARADVLRVQATDGPLVRGAALALCAVGARAVSESTAVWSVTARYYRGYRREAVRRARAFAKTLAARPG